MPAPAPAPALGSKCPFAGLLAAPAAQNGAADKPGEAERQTSYPADCPVLEKQSSAPAEVAASAAEPATCPYGFGSSAKGDLLSALHCAR